MTAGHDDFVAIAPRGRLGNQLFEFACAYACAQRTGSRVLFHDWTHSGVEGYRIERLLGPAFAFASPRELLRVWQFDYDIPLRSTLNGWLNRVEASTHRTSRRVLLEEDYGGCAQVHTQILEAQPPVLLSGFFQNEGYFSDASERVAAAIALPGHWEAVRRELAGPILAVHFRRGDYVHHGLNLPLAYYFNALEYAREQIEPRTLLLFSEDAEFLELIAPWLADYGEVRLATEWARDDIDHLALMALCDHQIVANSSFAWWGAWLSEQRSDGACRVIAPSGWIAGQPETIPDRWISVPTVAEQPLPWEAGE